MTETQNKSGRIVLTPRIIEELRAHSARTGIGAVKLLKNARNVPDGLKAHMVYDWMAGRVKKAKPEHLKYLMRLWDEQQGRKYIELTDDMRQTLARNSAQTGISAKRLLQAAEQIPHGLNASQLQNWRYSETVKKIPADHWKFVINEWKKYEKSSHEIVELTDELRETLQGYKQTTNIGPQALLKNTRHERPAGLTSRTIQRWIEHGGQTARKDHLDYVLKRWADLAALEQQRVPLMDSILSELDAHKRRTGIGPPRLLRNAQDVPQGLSTAMIHSWFQGKVATIRKDHLEYVLERWKGLPDAAHIEITPEIREKLQAYKERTGVGARRLLKDGDDAPPGLGASTINAWLSGATKTALKEHMSYVIAQWEEFAEEEQQLHIALTDDIMELLLTYREQGLLPSQVFQCAENIPQGLKPHTISRWLTRPKKIRRDHWEFVRSRCKELETHTSRRIVITEDMREALVKEQTRTDTGPIVLLRNAIGVPKGLTAHVVAGWISKNAKTGQKDHYDYVLDRWRNWPSA